MNASTFEPRKAGAPSGAAAAWRVTAWAVALAAAVWLARSLATYAGVDGYLDHMEPNLAVRSWLFLDHWPLYRRPNMAMPTELAVSTYGPVAYLAEAGALALAGASVAASKLPGLAAAALSVAVFAAVAWRRWRGMAAPAAAVTFLGLMLAAGPAVFWNRPDSLLVLAMTAAVAAVGTRSHAARAALVGALLGLAVNLKIHAFVYFLPLLPDALGERPWRALAILATVAAAVAWVPFLDVRIDLVAYLAGLWDVVGGTASDPELVARVLRHGLLYLSPVVVLAALALGGRGEIKGDDLVRLALLAAGLAAAMIPASKVGSGTHALVPLIPITAALAGRFLDRLPAGRSARLLLVAFPLAFLIIAVPVQRRLARALAEADRPEVAAEIGQWLAEVPGATLEMGYGDRLAGYPRTYLRPLLVFAGRGFTLEALSAMEVRKLGRPLPGPIVGRIRACAVDYWLIPRGEAPFAMPSYYGGGAFDEPFRAAFLQAYELRRSRAWFDLWGCRNRKG